MQYLVDALARLIPDTVTVCQHLTCRLLDRLTQGEVPVNVSSIVEFKKLSLLQLVDLTTQNLEFRQVGQAEEEQRDLAENEILNDQFSRNEVEEADELDGNTVLGEDTASESAGEDEMSD